MAIIYPRTKTTKRCHTCGKSFEATKYTYRIYCSDNCEKIARFKARFPGTIIRTCCVCGEEFACWKSAKKMWCSPKCYGKLEGEKLKKSVRYFKGRLSQFTGLTTSPMPEDKGLLRELLKQERRDQEGRIREERIKENARLNQETGEKYPDDQLWEDEMRKAFLKDKTLALRNGRRK